MLIMFNQSTPEPERADADDPRKDFLRPAFLSNTTAYLFVILIIFILLLPKIFTNYDLVSREDSYEIMPRNFGEYAFLKDEVFNKKEDIDILFIGTSITWNAVDTPQVQAALSQKLGRKARVLTLGYYFSGLDVSYTLLRDILERRRVRMIVFSIPRDEEISEEGPSLPGCKFLRYKDSAEILEKLPLESKISLYACNTLRTPHDLLNMVREDKTPPSSIAKNLGANKEYLGMDRDPKTFVRFTPPPPVFSGEELIYTDSNKTSFRFLNEKPSEHQNYYLREIFNLAGKKDVPLIMLNIPQYAERRKETVLETQNWSENYKPETPMIGIPPGKLFEGLSEDGIEKLYCDDDHFNVNGTEYFTKAILPGILKVYEKAETENF